MSNYDERDGEELTEYGRLRKINESLQAKIARLTADLATVQQSHDENVRRIVELERENVALNSFKDEVIRIKRYVDTADDFCIEVGALIRGDE